MVVDDLGLSFENIVRVREALKKYVEGQMQPGDLVALVRTGGGVEPRVVVRPEQRAARARQRRGDPDARSPTRLSDDRIESCQRVRRPRARAAKLRGCREAGAPQRLQSSSWMWCLVGSRALAIGRPRDESNCLEDAAKCSQKATECS